MNELVERLRSAQQKDLERTSWLLEDAINALNAADRMASALGSLHQEAFINMKGGHGAVLDDAAAAFNAYQLATIGTATQKKD